MTFMWQPEAPQTVHATQMRREVTHKTPDNGPSLAPPAPAVRLDPGITLADSSTSYTLHTETRQALVHLSQARAEFLELAERQGRRPIIISDGLSALTEPMRQALVTARGGWAVRGSDGTLRNGLTGRRMTEVTEALNLAPVRALDQMAVNHLRSTPATHARLRVTVSLRVKGQCHRHLGHTVNALMFALANQGPAAYGLYEPALGLPTQDAAEQLIHTPQAARNGVVVSGPAEVPASLMLRHTSLLGATDETLTGLIGLGELGDPLVVQRLGRLEGAMRTLQDCGEVTFALFRLQPGGAGLATPPAVAHADSLVAMVLGAALVRAAGLDAGLAARTFNALPLGRHGSLWFPLDQAGAPAGLALVKALAARETGLGCHETL
ncbi:MAG: DUF6177 family protein [Bifidobacteriaceae bacterium]|jgi:hypothetical protein|nr:DUF6177 family protein [Bifidobacteriaceae bacterium]